MYCGRLQLGMVAMLELTVPWKERLEEARERKKLKYQGLVDDCRDNNWRVLCLQVEVGDLSGSRCVAVDMEEEGGEVEDKIV